MRVAGINKYFCNKKALESLIYRFSQLTQNSHSKFFYH